jgi:molybdopterin molybdotransferase
VTAPGRPALLGLDEVVERIVREVSAAGRLPAETVSTFDALGRTLAVEVRSPMDVPPADNSSMDGYALRVADVAEAGALLPVSQRIPAGVVGEPLQAATAARIFTGAQIPVGADTVVMQEDTQAEGEGVRITAVPMPGQWIRRRGEDVTRDSVVLAAGRRLDPQGLGLAASVGCATLEVVRRPRVALFSTGDELVMPGSVPPDRLRPGAIYNSNRYTHRALLQALGCEINDLGIVPDRLAETRSALRQAAEGHDLILTCGGVSVGEEDHLRPAVQAEGEVDFLQMAIKPGKPLAFGHVRRATGRTWLIGLPGNPVSSFVTFLLVVRPALLAMLGSATGAPAPQVLRADFDWPRPDRRREFLRARRNPQGGLDLFPNQSSGVLTSAVWADGVVDNPPSQPIRRGDTVRFLSFAEWLR